ncbi:hypothetical protein G7Y79_00006g020290 [Physcia stellaris]|nr:hypothetical protein G7Y79_00006g020290 [Physcia stellaris]
MLVLPMRSPQYLRGLQNQDGDPHTKLLQEHHIPDHRPTLTLHQQSTDAMLSVMATPISGPKRPKLSLQTANVSTLPATHRSKTALSLSVVTPSPTAGNTQGHIFQTPPDTNMAGEAVLPNHIILGSYVSLFPNNTLLFTHGSTQHLAQQPFATTGDYLNNSKDSQGVVPASQRLEDEIAERKALDDLLEKEENSTGSVDHRRRRRRKRDWIWRPLEDDIQRDISHPKNPTIDDMRHSWHASELKREKTVPEISPWCREQPVAGKALGLLGVENRSLQMERHP